MYTILFILLLVLLFIILSSYSRRERNDQYNRNTKDYNRDYQTQPSSKGKKTLDLFQQYIFASKPFRPIGVKPKNKFDDASIAWCANFLEIEEGRLKEILKDIRDHYSQFRLKKRSTGYRTISAPTKELLAIQRIIYLRILLPVNIHPAATGFRRGLSIVNNAEAHLGNKYVLKADIHDFFGSIQLRSVKKALTNIGYPSNIVKVLAQLCCLRSHLPQGAPTSPTLSNIIAYEMDKKLMALAKEHGLTYTRYADDLTFSGNAMDKTLLMREIQKIVKEEKLVLNKKKTHYISENKRKIITGISISSGEKLTIPKRKKRELRKNIHFILTKGLEEHQRYIGNSDPAYLKRIVGYLNFWLLVEPNNEYVKDSLKALKNVR